MTSSMWTPTPIPSPQGGGEEVLRVDRQPLDQGAAGARGGALQGVQMRPGRLGVHVVRRHRRDAAPVVDPCPDQLRQPLRLQVGGRLDVHARAQDQAGHRDGPQVIIERRLRRARHARIRLGAEVLDDHLLDMAPALVRGADGEQRLDALAARLADTDQQPGRERHAGAPGGLQGGEARGGRLVGRSEVRSATLGEALRRGLQHHALGD